MAAIDFPTSPGDGQIFTAPNGNVYVFKASPAPGLWVAQVTLPGGSQSAMKLYSEIILGAPATELLPLVPAGFKMLDLEWHINSVAGVNKQIGLVYYRNGVAYSGGTYVAQKSYSLGTAPTVPAAAKVGPIAFWELGTGTTHRGRLRFSALGDLVLADGTQLVMDNGGLISQTSLALSVGGLTGGVMTGFKLGFVDTTNLDTGSWARVNAVW